MHTTQLIALLVAISTGIQALPATPRSEADELYIIYTGADAKRRAEADESYIIYTTLREKARRVDPDESYIMYTVDERRANTDCTDAV